MVDGMVEGEDGDGDGDGWDVMQSCHKLGLMERYVDTRDGAEASVQDSRSPDQGTGFGEVLGPMFAGWALRSIVLTSSPRKPKGASCGDKRDS